LILADLLLQHIFLSNMKVWLMTIIFVSSGAFRILKKTRKDASVVIPLSDAPIAEGGEPALYDDEGADVGKLGAEPSQAEIASESETNDTNIQSCGCRGPELYSYQQWPLAQGTIGCIGGCGGSEFQINRRGGTIKQLMVWTNNARRRNSHIKAIRFTYNDDHAVLQGNPTGASGPWSHNFQPGEYVVDDLKLSGNGRGKFLGSIEFTTSAGTEFKVGMTGPHRYHFPTGGSYMAAFTGRVSDDGVHMLGVGFWKPIKEISYVSLTYPTLDSLVHIKNPERLNKRSYCNTLPFPVPNAGQKFERTVKTGTTSCLTSSSSSQFSHSVKVSGGIPFVAEVETEMKWVESKSSVRENCKTKVTEEKRTLTFPNLMIPPGSSFDYTFSQWLGKLSSLPFRAVLRVTLKDNTSFLRNEIGTYTGVSFSAIREDFENYKANVTSCSR